MDKMPRILFIGFGMEPFMRGGAITYQEVIRDSLLKLGWEVFFYIAAPRYTYRNTPHLIRRSLHKTSIIELVDPPYNVGHLYSPSLQCHNDQIDKFTVDILDEVKPDIVHIHELQFHTASIIDSISDRNIPVMKTLHNYYDLCPEGNLMYQGTEPCKDYDDGRRCAPCLMIRPVYFTNYKIKLGRLLPYSMNEWLHKKRVKLIQKKGGNTGAGMDQKSIITYPAEEYRKRREYFTERLNKLDIIHCSASRTAEIMRASGIATEKIKIIPLSNKKQDIIQQKSFRGSHYPVVFGFIAGKSLHKGYSVLMEAFLQLDHKKSRLIIWGVDEPDTNFQFMNIEYRKHVRDDEINDIFEQIDVLVFPSIWEEIFGLIGIECRTARVPVIGSNIGGIPEWLKNGESGFLVPPNDPGALAAMMERFVQNPALIAEIQRRTKPWKSFDTHIAELIDLYNALIAEKLKK